MNLTSFEKLTLMAFSSEEKQSFYQFMCGAMSVDRDRDPKEIEIINEVTSIMNLTPQERQASRIMSTESQLQVLKNMNELKKMCLAKVTANILLADGGVTAEENEFIKYYFKLLGIPEHP